MSPTNAGDFQAFSERQWKHLIESHLDERVGEMSAYQVPICG
jgi:hypothetical protein